MKPTECEIRDLALADEGLHRIRWADNDMPVLQQVRERFRKEQPLAGMRMSACLHITAETANLARTLKMGGAEVVLCASNPLSTQDDVAASLVRDYDIRVYAIHGIDNAGYYRHIAAAAEFKPHVTMDDGCDLVTYIHDKLPGQTAEMYGSMEETTTGVIRLRAMERAGVLKVPVIAVNDAKTKNMFDNRYGTGQSTIDGIIRATDILLAGKTVVVAGYGWCGRGFADRCRGMGANVVVTEVDPIKALEAAMDGFRVMPMSEAAPIGDLFCTMTGNKHVIRGEHMVKMKDGAIIANSGHFDIEIDIPTMEKLAKRVNRDVRRNVDEYTMKNGHRLFLLAEGRLINLSAAEGHPASVMDMSFSTQALATEFMVKNGKTLENRVYDPPTEIEDRVSRHKLAAMGLEIDTLTEEQISYLSEWQEGT
ncbi:MAG TPA: adenosylhomocysteinase [Bacteroidetes bacterium]|nr:adenosylhomocysteinase [Bacteroidota bacterium]